MGEDYVQNGNIFLLVSTLALCQWNDAIHMQGNYSPWLFLSRSTPMSIPKGVSQQFPREFLIQLSAIIPNKCTNPN